MLSGRVAALLAVSAALGGCGRDPQVFDLPLHDAFAKLADNRLEDFSLKRQCGILIHLTPDAVPDESVTWRVYSSGEKVASFTARLTRVSASKTRVVVDVAKDADGSDAYDGKDDYPRPAFQQPLRPAVQEAIAAVLENRPFDEARLNDIPGDNRVCEIQRAGLESGAVRFTIDDEPGSAAQE